MMGTNKSSETLAEAALLRSLRTTTQAEVDERARRRGTQIRFTHTPQHDRHVPAAH